MAAVTAEQGERVVVVIDRILSKLEASGRRGRKRRDTSATSARLQKDMASAWRQLATDLRDEWYEPAIGHTFEAKRKGPTATQIDALYNRAKKRADFLTKKAIESATKVALKKGAFSAHGDIGSDSSWSVRSPEAEKWLQKNAADKVKAISENTRRRIKRLVVEMLEQGRSQKEVALEIDALVKGWSKVSGAVQSRGELIALTEVGEAYEQGRQQAVRRFEGAGLDVEKSWLGTGKICDLCSLAVSDRWISSQQAFSNGFDAPLAHPGCHCDLLLRVAV